MGSQPSSPKQEDLTPILSRHAAIPLTWGPKYVSGVHEKDGKEQLPKDLSKQKVALVGMQLTTLSNHIKCFASLTELDLSYNHLHQLPPALAQLTSLSVLILRSNAFTTLPKEILNLPSLTRLSLDNNRVTYWPRTPAQIPSPKT